LAKEADRSWQVDEDVAGLASAAAVAVQMEGWGLFFGKGRNSKLCRLLYVMVYRSYRLLLNASI
jgi:hypothetical protein